MRKFWMVIKATGIGADRTSCGHASKEIARQEAYRLSQTHGGDFFILEAVECMKEPEPAYMQSLVSLDVVARHEVEGTRSNNLRDHEIPF